MDNIIIHPAPCTKLSIAEVDNLPEIDEDIDE